MSLFESSHSTGEVSLAGLFAGETPTADGAHFGFTQLVQRIVIDGIRPPGGRVDVNGIIEVACERALAVIEESA